MNIRKLKKLKKNPKLFFNDMMKKRKSKVTNIKKLNGSYNILSYFLVMTNIKHPIITSLKILGMMKI